MTFVTVGGALGLVARYSTAFESYERVQYRYPKVIGLSLTAFLVFVLCSHGRYVSMSWAGQFATSAKVGNCFP
jgi:hypothetical protein